MTPAADREMAALEAQIKEGTDHGRQQEKKLLSRGEPSAGSRPSR